MSLISAFTCAIEKKPSDFDPGKILQTIRTGGKRLKQLILQIRNRFEAELAITNGDRKKAKAAIDGLKKKLPGVTWSGRFSERAGDNLLEHSGLLCTDLDARGDTLPEVREKLLASPHVWALFRSPSGDGLKCIFRVRANAALHRASFRAVQQHVAKLTGVEIDQSCKDVARLCFLSFDLDLYHNANATEIEPVTEPEKPKPWVFSPNGVVDLNARQRIATELLGEIQWDSETHGFFACPGKHLHTTGDGERDCEVHLDGAPNVHCFHDHCAGILAGINHELQSRIGKAEYAEERSSSTSAGNSADNETITRLAALPLLEYDRQRKDEAARLGCRESVLDKLVEERRPKKTSNGLQGTAVTLADVEPWPEAVNGAEVLDAVADTFTRYIVLPPGAADAQALWCAHTHCHRAFPCSPRLNVSSPEKNCGKTTNRDTIALFVPRPLLTENLTTAVLFRLVDAQSPVILADEYDSWMSDNEELRGLLNAGHRQGAMVYRCEGDNNEVRGFAAYAPAVLCGIGSLPGTLHDRSIVITLERAKRGEVQTRFDSRHTEAEHELCRKLSRWCSDNLARLAASDPQLPEGVFNRLADNWRPLFAIAEIAGGDWPQRCADAFARLTRNDADADGIRILLLTDIQQLFTGERMFSKDLTGDLAQLTERPWSEVCRGKPITERWLARNLVPFGIRSGNIRIGEKQAKGYERAHFNEVFARYLPDWGFLSVPPSHTEVKTEKSIRPKDKAGTDEKTGSHEALGRWDACKTPEAQQAEEKLHL